MSNKDVLKLLRVFERPLETRPGTAYAYVNVNWVIAGYIVEQVSPDAAAAACSGWWMHSSHVTLSSGHQLLDVPSVWQLHCQGL